MPIETPKPPDPTVHRRPAAELRRRFSGLITRAALTQPGRYDLFRHFDAILADFEPRLADALSVSITSGFLSGAEASLVRLPFDPVDIVPTPLFGAPPDKPPSLPPLLLPSPDDGPRAELTAIQEAAERLARRHVMSPDDYYRLAGDAKAQAFTVAGGLTDDTRHKLHQLLTADIAEGVSFTGFREQVLDQFDRLPIAEHHLEQVYRNNVNESFSQGMEHVLANRMVADEFPYRLYVPIHDARARPEHRELERLGLSGTAVYHKDDPTWLKFRPPWSWGCRCGWIAINVADAARRGVEEAIEWRETGIEPAHHWVTPPPFNPPVGWNRTALGAAA